MEVLAEKAHKRAKEPQSVFDFSWLERVGGCLVGCIVLGLGLHRQRRRTLVLRPRGDGVRHRRTVAFSGGTSGTLCKVQTADTLALLDRICHQFRRSRVADYGRDCVGACCVQDIRRKKSG